jgi:hypothetical protein
MDGQSIIKCHFLSREELQAILIDEALQGML